VPKQYVYQTTTSWTGNTGRGTADDRAYRRDHEITAEHKSGPVFGSSDAAFRGDRSRYNPEELLVASLCACHTLWALHLCADAGIVVTSCRDDAIGTMALSEDGGGQFTKGRPASPHDDQRRRQNRGSANVACPRARAVLGRALSQFSGEA